MCSPGTRHLPNTNELFEDLVKKIRLGEDRFVEHAIKTYADLTPQSIIHKVYLNASGLRCYVVVAEIPLPDLRQHMDIGKLKSRVQEALDRHMEATGLTNVGVMEIRVSPRGEPGNLKLSVGVEVALGVTKGPTTVRERDITDITDRGLSVVVRNTPTPVGGVALVATPEVLYPPMVEGQGAVLRPFTQFSPSSGEEGYETIFVGDEEA
jgi:hypothetical protein